MSGELASLDGARGGLDLSALSVVKRRAGREVLRGANLHVRSGEVAALVGPSGSGKSTLLRCLNGLDDFDAGEVRVGPTVLTSDLSATSRAAALTEIRARVGMVFQQFHLFAHLSAIENVALAPRVTGRLTRNDALAQARALLDRVGLSGFEARRPSELSGGQQQRVAIARTLAMRPRAILFDEPTSALDPTMTAEVLEVIADLARDGLTMIVVTHAMAFARSVANSVHVFVDGAVVESGPPDQIFGDPRHEATRALLAHPGAFTKRV